MILFQKARILEDAAKGTLMRWKTDPEQKRWAEDNVEFAVATRIVQNNDLGFTNRNGERERMCQVDNDSMVFALLYNMIELADCAKQRNISFGSADAYISMVVLTCHSDVAEIEERLRRGLSEYYAEKASHISNPNRSVDCDFSARTVEAYTEYNSLHHYVSVDTPIATPHYQIAANNLINHFSEKQSGYVGRR